MVPLCSGGRTPNRGRQPPELCQPHMIARCEGSDKTARAATIFIHNGAPQALVGSQAVASQAVACMTFLFSTDPRIQVRGRPLPKAKGPRRMAPVAPRAGAARTAPPGSSPSPWLRAGFQARFAPEGRFAAPCTKVPIIEQFPSSTRGRNFPPQWVGARRWPTQDEVGGAAPASRTRNVSRYFGLRKSQPADS
jgi:hypothetical protein